MTSQEHEGWAPHPPKVKRQITIHADLDAKLVKLAREYRCTPSALIEDALTEYIPMLRIAVPDLSNE